MELCLFLICQAETTSTEIELFLCKQKPPNLMKYPEKNLENDVVRHVIVPKV